MYAFLDFVPVVVFFVVYRYYDIYAATLALIISMGALILFQWLHKRTVSKMLLVSGGFAAVLGGITLWQRDPLFLQWKPTIVYWIFAVVLLVTDAFMRENVFQKALGEVVKAQRSAWRVLNAIWIVVFAVMGIANLYVAFTFDMDTWVDFKLYSAIGITALSLLVTGLFVYRYLPQDER